MSFAEGFYSYSLEISDPARNLYTKIRLKTPRHPHEPLEFLQARLVAYAHAYLPGLQFSQGMLSPDEPTIWERDSLNGIKRWIEVGCPTKKSLEKALRLHATDYRIYLTSPEDLRSLVHLIHEIRSKSLGKISIFRLEDSFIEKISSSVQSSSTWQATFTDDHLFLMANGEQFETTIQKIDLETIQSEIRAV